MSLRILSKGDETKPIINYDTFTYLYELMTAGSYDKVLFTSPEYITSNTKNNDKLQIIIRELIPILNVGSDIIVEVTPDKAHGNRPHPYYRLGHKVKMHIIVKSVN